MFRKGLIIIDTLGLKLKKTHVKQVWISKLQVSENRTHGTLILSEESKKIYFKMPRQRPLKVQITLRQWVRAKKKSSNKYATWQEHGPHQDE